jgi:hypothetical protein
MPTATAVATQIGFCSTVPLENCTDVNNFFRTRKAQEYIKWFNATLAAKGAWDDVKLVDTAQNDVLFFKFWNRIDQIFGGKINLIQFVSLMSIFSNETRGNFTPPSERMGLKGHPGMAYLFDKIEGLKRSYNTLAGNQTAFQCFNDPDYIAAHGMRAGATAFTRTTDTRWSGEVWPSGVPTDADPAVSGFIMEADFMKFRGRGLIQTTGRANYLHLIMFIQNYTGDNETLLHYKTSWIGELPDQIASASSNEDWDTLFQKTDLIIAAEAVRIHNAAAGNYLALSSDPATLTGTGKGSLFRMGKAISGGDTYANRFRARVGEVLAAI